MEPVEPVLKNIYQSNTYRKELSWLHFGDEPRVQEKQQVKDQQSCIYRDTEQPQEKNFIERIRAPVFLEEVLAIEII